MRIFAVLFAALSLLGACAGDDDLTVAEPDATEATEATDAPADSDETGAVEVAESDLGEILTDGEGNTLYVFANDEGTTSSCSGPCAEMWPAFETDGEPEAGDGVDEDELDTNDDGQVVYAGHPLYTYSGDTEAGQTNGHGVGGNWFALSPDGEPIEAD